MVVQDAAHVAVLQGRRKCAKEAAFGLFDLNPLCRCNQPCQTVQELFGLFQPTTGPLDHNGDKVETARRAVLAIVRYFALGIVCCS